MLIILLFFGGILSFNLCRANYSKRTDLSEPLQSWQMLSVAVQHWTWWILSNEANLHEYCRWLILPLNLLFVFNTYVSQVSRRCFSSENHLCSIYFLSTCLSFGIAAQSSWWNGLSRRIDGDCIWPKKGQICGPCKLGGGHWPSRWRWALHSGPWNHSESQAAGWQPYRGSSSSRCSGDDGAKHWWRVAPGWWPWSLHNGTVGGTTDRNTEQSPCWYLALMWCGSEKICSALLFIPKFLL